MDITQTFYNNLATVYDKRFGDWDAAVREQAVMLDWIFASCGPDRSACANPPAITAPCAGRS